MLWCDILCQTFCSVITWTIKCALPWGFKFIFSFSASIAKIFKPKKVRFYLKYLIEVFKFYVHFSSFNKQWNLFKFLFCALGFFKLFKSKCLLRYVWRCILSSVFACHHREKSLGFFYLLMSLLEGIQTNKPRQAHEYLYKT